MENLKPATHSIEIVPNYFRGHVQSSISINLNRRKAYAILTNGKSNEIFLRLIVGEIATLIPAAYFDFKSKSYHRRGIPLLKDEFKDMHVLEETPTIKSLPLTPFRYFDFKLHSQYVAKAIQQIDLELVKSTCLQAINELLTMPAYYCMTRHMFESIYRFAYFTPLRQEQARTAKYKDPTRLLFQIMKLHLLGIPGSYQIDLLARPIQAQGINILFSEIPDLIHDLNINKTVIS